MWDLDRKILVYLQKIFGQDVITAGGIYGKVKSIEGNVVVLEIASGVKIRIDKNSIYADAAATQQQAK